MKITEVRNTAWRDALLPAAFRGALFHVEVGAQQNGRRIVVHEFPKRDVPYPEDMGRSAKQWHVRGYVIAYPIDTGLPLYQRDYRQARNALIAALEADGPATLQLPTIPPVVVVSSQYRWTEEQRFGGFCAFDMSFIEYGNPSGLAAQPSATSALNDQAAAMKTQVLSVLAGATEITRVRAISQPVQ